MYFVSVNLKSFGIICLGERTNGRQVYTAETNYSTVQSDFGDSRPEAIVAISKLLTGLDVKAVPCQAVDGISELEAASIDRKNRHTILDTLCLAAIKLRASDVNAPVSFTYGVQDSSGKALIEIEVKEQVK